MSASININLADVSEETYIWNSADLNSSNELSNPLNSITNLKDFQTQVNNYISTSGISFVKKTGDTMNGTLTINNNIVFGDGTIQSSGFTNQIKTNMNNALSDIQYISSTTDVVTGNKTIVSGKLECDDLIIPDNTLSTSKITGLANGINNITNQINTINTNIDTINTTNTSQSSLITGLRTDVTTNTTNITTNTNSINTINTTLGTKQNNITSTNRLSSDLVSASSGTLTAKLTSLDSSITNLSNTKQDNITSSNKLSSSNVDYSSSALRFVDINSNLQQTLNDISSVNTTQSNRLSTVENNVSLQSDAITGLQSDTLTNTNNITSIQSTVNNNTTLLTSHSQNIQQLLSDVSGNIIQIDANTSDISDINNTLSSHTNTLNTHSTLLSNLQNEDILLQESIDLKQNIIDNSNKLNASYIGNGDIVNNELSTLAGIEQNHTIQYQINQLKNSVNNLTGLQDIDITDINNIQDTLTSVSNRLSSLETEDNTQNTFNNNVNDQLSTLLTSVNTKQNEINTSNKLSSDLVETGNTVLTDKLSSLDTSITSINSSISSLQTNSTLQTNINNSVSSSITTLQNNIDNKQNIIDDNNLLYWDNINTGNDITLDNKIGSIETSISTAQSDITTLETGLSTAQSDITNLNSSITSTQSDITTLQSGLSTAQSDITTSNNAITSIQSDITTLQSDVSTAQSNITTLQSDVSTAQSNITTSNSSITSIQSDITDINSNIQTLTTSINTKQDVINSSNKLDYTNVSFVGSNLTNFDINTSLNGSLSTLSNSIDGINTEITSMNTAIENLQSADIIHSSAITQIGSDITDLQTNKMNTIDSTHLLSSELVETGLNELLSDKLASLDILIAGKQESITSLSKLDSSLVDYSTSSLRYVDISSNLNSQLTTMTNAISTLQSLQNGDIQTFQNIQDNFDAVDTSLTGKLAKSGDTITGDLVFGSGAKIKYNSGASGQVLTSDSSGNLTLQDPQTSSGPSYPSVSYDSNNTTTTITDTTKLTSLKFSGDNSIQTTAFTSTKDTNLTNVISDVSTLSTDNTTNKSNISTLQTDLTSLTSTVNNKQNTINSSNKLASSNVDYSTSPLQYVDSGVTQNISTSLSGLSSSISVLQSSDTTQTNNISTLSTSLSSLQSSKQDTINSSNKISSANVSYGVSSDVSSTLDSINTSLSDKASLSGATFTGDITAPNFIGNASTATTASNVVATNTNFNGTFYPTFVSSSGTSKGIQVDSTTTPLTYNPSTSTLTASIFSGALLGNATTATTATTATNCTTATSATSATNASNIGVTLDTTTNSTHYVPFVGATTGNNASKVSTGLTYNPNTQTLTALNFNGNATTSSGTSQIAVADFNTNTTNYITFVTNANNQAQTLRMDNSVTPLTYNPSTSTLSLGALKYASGTAGQVPISDGTGLLTLGTLSSSITKVSGTWSIATPNALSLNLNGWNTLATLTLTAGTWYINANFVPTPSIITVSNAYTGLALSTGGTGSIFYMVDACQNGGNSVTARANWPTINYIYTTASTVTLTLYVYCYIVVSSGTLTYNQSNNKSYFAIKLA